jgi:hypothetical protein
MHGTAFLISTDGLMLTNVHNVKSCLDAHGLAFSGYNGKNGDLDCTELSMFDRAYMKMLENLKLRQYNQGFIRSYPDADNGLKASMVDTKVIRHSLNEWGITLL